MSKSPGHRKWPDHDVREVHLDTPMRVEVDGKVVAESNDVILVDEVENPARYYFRRSDVRMDLFERSSKTTKCPFKGTATHFSLDLGDRKQVKDVAWSYEEPYDEHVELRQRLAFYADEIEAVEVVPPDRP
jgi:uncharacterized protein (DUF427 family)